MEEKQRIYCPKCRHYHVTWDPGFPHGCRLFGFKTSTMPAIMVYQSTGKQCEHFETETKRKSDSYEPGRDTP